MKKPAEWAGFFDLYFYFTGLAEIVGQKKMRKWGGFACASSHISESGMNVLDAPYPVRDDGN